MTAFTDTAPVRPAEPPEALSAESATVADKGVSEDAGIDLADQVLRLVRSWTYLKARMVSTLDPDVSSLFLIGRLIKDGPTRAKDLAEATCADQSTVSRQVAGLVKAGLLERQADPDDGRASILVPTPLGVERWSKHFANRGRAMEPLLTDWSEEERQQFVQLLRRFTSNLEARRDDVAKLMAKSHLLATAPVPEAPAESHPAHVHPHASTERSN